MVLPDDRLLTHSKSKTDMETVFNVDKGFLAEGDFRRLASMFPEKGWKQASVYRTDQEREVVVPESRYAKKVVERRDEVLREIRSLVMPPVLQWLRRRPGFMHCWFRYSHTEWLWYKEGMFFQEHKDFEKYLCSNLVPYVGLMGLEDTVEGGETVVEGVPQTGSARRNGFVFFPGNVPHEASVVRSGEKRCLKLEFFVVFASPPTVMTEVSDARHQWRSFWSPQELALVPNYMGSHRDFAHREKLMLTTDMAKRIHDVMLTIADPRRHRPRASAADVDMVFPTFSVSCLHDLFLCVHLIERWRVPAEPVTPLGPMAVLGTDPDAWDFLNTWSDFPSSGFVLVAALWYQKKGSVTDDYRVGEIRWREGSVTTSPCTDTSVDYRVLQQHMIHSFVAQTDLETWKVDEELVPRPAHPHPQISSVDMKKILTACAPSDWIEKPERVRGRVTVRNYEMCNDGESGGTYETYTVYKSYRIQTRWCLIRV